MNLRTLTRLKWVDTIGQVACVMITPLFTMASGEATLGLMAIFITLGGWQTVSALGTVFLPNHDPRWKTPARKFYLALLVPALLMLVYIFRSSNLAPGIVLLIVAPIMAVLYLILSCVELGNLQDAAGEADRRPGP